MNEILNKNLFSSYAMRYFVVAVFALIIFSLGSALFYMMKDKSGTNRTVRALTWRVGLSVGLFVFLILGTYLGWIPGRL